jgi:hypothetical protein
LLVSFVASGRISEPAQCFVSVSGNQGVKRIRFIGQSGPDPGKQISA